MKCRQYDLIPHSRGTMDDNKTNTLRILFITDSPTRVPHIQGLLADTGHSLSSMIVSRTRGVRMALPEIKRGRFDIFLIDGASGTCSSPDIIHSIHQSDNLAEIILILGPPSANTAPHYRGDIIRDYIQYPLSREHLIQACERALERRRRLNAYFSLEPWSLLPMTDIITGLYNRSYFHARIAQEIASARRKKVNFSVMLIKFAPHEERPANESSPLDDITLQAVADEIRRACRISDTLARCGHDEIGVLLLDAPSSVVHNIAERFLSIVADGCERAPVGRGVRTAIGVSSYPDHAADRSGLLRKADLALAFSRKRGGNTFTLYHCDCGTSSAHIR